MKEALGVIIPIVIGVSFYSGMIAALVLFLIRRSKIKKIRNGICIFTQEKLDSTLIQDDSYYKSDREVYKIGIENGGYYREANTTTIKGEFVKGNSSYELRSNSLGYVIIRSEKPFSVNITPKWAMDSDDRGTYVDKTEIKFKLLKNGSLTQKQQEQLEKLVKAASYNAEFF